MMDLVELPEDTDSMNLAVDQQAAQTARDPINNT